MRPYKRRMKHPQHWYHTKDGFVSKQEFYKYRSALEEQVSMWQRILIPIYSWIFRNYLFYHIGNTEHKGKIVRVKGWRTMLVDCPGRMTIAPIFWWFK